jgi:hypothetical protein
LLVGQVVAFHFLSLAEAAALDRKEQAEKRKRLREGLRSGAIMAARLGALFGVVTGGIGLALGWVGRDEPAGIAILFGASLVIGVVSVVILFFVISLVCYSLGAGEG